jgi:hypothetical protein
MYHWVILRFQIIAVLASVTNDAPLIFPIGITNITWTITDVHGNSTTVQQQVIVTDDQPPVVMALLILH